MAVEIQEVATNGNYTVEQDGGPALTEISLAGSEKHPFTFNAPTELYDAIVADAKGRTLPDGTVGVTNGSVILDIVASHYGFDVIDNTGGRKRVTGLSKEQKASIAKTKRDAQKDFMKQLMADMLKGTLTPAKVEEAMKAMAAKVTAAGK